MTKKCGLAVIAVLSACHWPVPSEGLCYYRVVMNEHDYYRAGLSPIASVHDDLIIKYEAQLVNLYPIIRDRYLVFEDQCDYDQVHKEIQSTFAEMKAQFKLEMVEFEEYQLEYARASRRN